MDKDGVSAFPLMGRPGITPDNEGMTLRQYYAAKAMQAFCSDTEAVQSAYDIARNAFFHADAMIEWEEQGG
tara:strand:+ start:240 stop:452 length:213 start_codon:yes stop_codon:yes gene_type:complete